MNYCEPDSHLSFPYYFYLYNYSYQAKGEVWYAKDLFVNAGCEGYKPMTTDSEGADRRLEYYNTEHYTSGPNFEICAAKAAALAAAKAKLAAAINNVLQGIAALGEAASGCESVLGITYANHYRALWEYATSNYGPDNLGYLSTCLDKIKYLLEALLGLDKVILAKTSYAIVLEEKLDAALQALAACEATYPNYETGYGYEANTLWNQEKVYAYDYYSLTDPRYAGEWKYHDMHEWLSSTEDSDFMDGLYGANYDSTSSGSPYSVYKFPKCKDILATVAWLQGEICYVEKKLLAAVAETVKVGTVLAAKSAKCFPASTGRRM